MRNIKNLLVGILVILSLGLSGCAMQKDVNKSIAASNAQRFESYTKGMAGCGQDESCKLGLSMAFAGNMGMQQFYREDSVVDYLKAGLGYATIAQNIFFKLSDPSTGDNKGGINIIGDHNQLSDVGTTKVADNGSVLNATLGAEFLERHNTNVGEGSASSDDSQSTEILPPVETPVEVVE